MTSSSGVEFVYANGTTQPGPAGDAPPAATGPAAVPPTPAASAAPLAAQPPAGPGPRLARREVWVDVPEYDGFKVKLWINYPQHWDQDMLGINFRPQPDHDGVTIQDLRAWSDEREASQREAYGRVVLEHNGWLDFEGNPLPQPQDPRFWELIPTELAAVVVALQKQASAELPNSIQPRRRR